MSKISGVLVTSISKIAGKTISTIQKVSGLTKTSIPSWPSDGPTCSTEQFMYGRDLTEACNGRFAFYEFDSTNGVIYNSGQCGVQTAAPGYYQYYADNMVYYFDGSRLSLVGPCKGGK